MALNTAQVVCKEKQVLLETYQFVTETYSGAVRELLRNMGFLSKEDFDKAFYKLTEVMLQDVAASRFRLQAHIRQHYC